ncbi:hypothetical protein [Streptomyces achromogenes]|uniref:hypothetical protein n=1 Tax=Streptomyces achromogenes TaxID=67255 RepID=UPI000A59C963|nr:hypothetical protein [Streptomyces achromogenes]
MSGEREDQAVQHALLGVEGADLVDLLHVLGHSEAIEVAYADFTALQNSEVPGPHLAP